MAREESAAERSLRELQEQAGGTATPSAGPTEPGGPARRRNPVVALLVAAVALAAVAVAAVVVIDSVTSGSESDDDNSRFARSFAEANALQTTRGEEARDAVEALEVPDAWTPAEDPSISMNESDGGSFAFYDVSFTLPARYSGDDFSSWFEAEDVVTASNPEDVTCASTGGGATLSCEVRFEEDEDGSTGPEPPRQTVTVTYTAPAEGLEGNVAIRGYSTAVKG